MLAELLGTSVQRIREWESGRAGIPRILPAALKGVETELRRAARKKLRSLKARASASQRRRNRVRRVKKARALSAAAQAQRKFYRDAQRETFRLADAFVRQIERDRRDGPANGRMLKLPKPGIGRMRKIRSDQGQKHRWRGRPGFKLRPEDISNEE